MIMVDGCPQMADVHDRMPVLLARDECDIWT
jgi:putative SOS response-associated peptidase YedK